MSEKTSNVTVEELKAFADVWDRYDVDTIRTFFTDILVRN